MGCFPQADEPPIRVHPVFQPHLLVDGNTRDGRSMASECLQPTGEETTTQHGQPQCVEGHEYIPRVRILDHLKHSFRSHAVRGLHLLRVFVELVRGVHVQREHR